MPAKTTKSSSRGRSGSARKSTCRSRNARRSSHSGPTGILTGIIELIRLTYFGRVLMFLLLASIFALLNILLSRNQFDLFFRLMGIEMVVTAVFFWLRFLLKRD